MRDAIYTYEGFMKAVAKFPKLCGENNTSDDNLTACKKEIATLFAHFTQETSLNSQWDNDNGTPFHKQGLYFTHELGCPDGGNACDYLSSGDAATIWPAQSG